MPFKNSSAGYCIISNFFVEFFCCFVRNAAHFIGLFLKRNSLKWDRLSSLSSNPSPLDYFLKQERDPQLNNYRQFCCLILTWHPGKIKLCKQRRPIRIHISQTAVFLECHNFRRHLAHGGSISLMITAFHSKCENLFCCYSTNMLFSTFVRLSCLHHVIWLPFHLTACFSFSFVFL